MFVLINKKQVALGSEYVRPISLILCFLSKVLSKIVGPLPLINELFLYVSTGALRLRLL